MRFVLCCTSQVRFVWILRRIIYIFAFGEQHVDFAAGQVLIETKQYDDD